MNDDISINKAAIVRGSEERLAEEYRDDQATLGASSFQGMKDDLAFLAHHPDLELAMVFGSTVSGNAKPDSDIDVAFYPRHPLDHQVVQRLSDQIALATGRPVDLVDLSSSDGALLRQILRTGKILFSKRPGIIGTLSERLLAWQEDFEPALNAMFAARLKRFTHELHGS